MVMIQWLSGRGLSFDKRNPFSSSEYSQVDPEPDVEVIELEKPLPEFHGEPVPSDDDDALFEGLQFLIFLILFCVLLLRIEVCDSVILAHARFLVL